MENKKELKIYNVINNISKKIGLKEGEKTILEVGLTQDKDVKSLSLTSGSWDNAEPWFVIDESEKIHTLVSLETLSKMVESLKDSSKENFELKLEKTIWQHFPVDFGDVWVVAMDEIRSIAKKTDRAKAINIDLDKLVNNIKKKHPFLFVDMENIHKNMTQFNHNNKLD